MKIGHTIDNNGFYTGDVLSESGLTPPVTVLCPNGFYKPKWNGSAWVEGLTQTEIDAITNVVPIPSLQEQVQQMQAVINDIIFGGI
jgi:hypothetical protein